MIWAVICALIVSLAINVLLSVLVFKVSSSTSDVLDRSHERTTEYTQDLLDRLAARDWPDYQSTKLWVPEVTSAPEVEEVDMVPTPGPDRGGFGSRLGLAAYAGVDEIRPEEEMP